MKNQDSLKSYESGSGNNNNNGDNDRYNGGM